MSNTNKRIIGVLFALFFAVSLLGDVAADSGNTTGTNYAVSPREMSMPMPIQYYSPVIELETTYISDTLQADQIYVYKVQIKNVGSKDITIDPKLNSNYPIMYPMAAGVSSISSGATISSGAEATTVDSNVLKATSTSIDTVNSSSAAPMPAIDIPVSAPMISVGNNGQILSSGDINISAPETIKANQTVDMYITVTVPADAVGGYYSSIDMNVNNEQNNPYNPQLSLNFMIQPKIGTPFVKTFTLTNDALITIDVSTDTYSSDKNTRVSPAVEPPTFDVILTHDGNEANLTLVKEIDSGNVGLGMSYPVWSKNSGNAYQSYGDHYVKTYKVQGEQGDYSLTIKPDNINNFGYSITIGN